MYHRWPALAKAQPRLLHIESLFDSLCAELVATGGVSEDEAPRFVGLWMAAETEAEINLRHLESVRRGRGSAPTGHEGLDEDLFEQTVDRLMELRPSLSRAQAVGVVEALARAR